MLECATSHLVDCNRGMGHCRQNERSQEGKFPLSKMHSGYHREPWVATLCIASSSSLEPLVFLVGGWVQIPFPLARSTSAFSGLSFSLFAFLHFQAFVRCSGTTSAFCTSQHLQVPGHALLHWGGGRFAPRIMIKELFFGEGGSELGEAG